MSCISTFCHTADRIITIDLRAPEWGRHTWGCTCRIGRGAPPVYRMPERCAYSDLRFLVYPQDRWQMVVTSTISTSMQIGLRVFAVWPDVPYSDVRRMIHLLSLVILQYFQYLYIFASFKNGQMQNLMESFPVTVYYTLTVIKLTALWKYHR